MEGVESVIEMIQADVGSLGKGLHDVESEMSNLTMKTGTCEAVANSYKNNNELQEQE